ncbi:MAG: sigma-70 family RNA polymerase sigma factor [Polyangiaceae bacterium]
MNAHLINSSSADCALCTGNATLRRVGAQRSDSEEDALFVQRLIARDELAFNELMSLYQERVFALVYRMLGSRAEAEDLCQEVFVRVFKNIHRFRGDSKLSTWIFRIAVNATKNRYKYNARRVSAGSKELGEQVEKTEFGGARGVSVSGVDRPDEMAQGRELEQIVKRAIHAIDPEFRQLVILRDVEDLSYDEIASVTGLPSGTVKSRIHRGRKQLRAKVETLMGEKLRQGGK